MTKAYVIRIKNDTASVSASKVLQDSSRLVGNRFEIELFDAITPNEVDSVMNTHTLKWNYPWQGGSLDFATGLYKSAYTTNEPKKRMGCFLSHYLLWLECVGSNEPMFIFEHDSIFLKKVDIEKLEESHFEVIALNDPRGATRKSALYWELMQKSSSTVVAVPKIDDDQIPQGLPGNSAYYIKPNGAKKLIELVSQLGAWPNDAIMCRQLMPNRLGVLRSPCTKVQGLKSTTTL